MKYLDALRREGVPQAAPAQLAKPTKPGFVSSAGTDATTFGTPPDSKPLTDVQERARRQVLALLDAHPHLARAFDTRVEHGTVVVTIGLRSGVTGELAIPKERLDPSNLSAYGELITLLSANDPDRPQ